jgi:hypothetical protein
MPCAVGRTSIGIDGALFAPFAVKHKPAKETKVREVDSSPPKAAEKINLTLESPGVCWALASVVLYLDTDKDGLSSMINEQ